MGYPPDREAILTEAYLRLQEHAAGYRGANVFRRAQAIAKANRDDQEARRKFAVHEFYARGIEAAARNIAEMIGIPEQDIARSDDGKGS